MKRFFTIGALALLTVACSHQNNYDASGVFGATEIVVSSEATGIILNFHIMEGDVVEAGMEVGLIDTVQLYLQKRQLEKQLASIRSGRPDVNKSVQALREQISKQETERLRVQNLLNDGAATQKQFDDIESSIKVLNGQLDAQLSNLNNSVSSINENVSFVGLQIEQIEDRLAKCHIVSPINGTVLAKYCEAGELASPGRALMKVADMDNVYLRAYFTSDQLADIKLGQDVKVFADFGGDSRIEYDGKIIWIASESEFTPKSIQTNNSRANMVYAVKIAVKNDGRIKLGLYGEVVL